MPEHKPGRSSPATFIHDGATPQRLLDARRKADMRDSHLRLVAIVKKTLAGAALAFLAVVALSPFVGNSTALFPVEFSNPTEGITQKDIVDGLALIANTSKGRFYELHARRGRVSGLHIREASLDEVDAKLILGDGRELTLSANHGLYDAEGQTLALNDNVNVLFGDGYSMTTKAAFIDLKERIAHSTDKVFVANPQSDLEAEGFTISQGGDKVRFEGRTRLTVHPRRNAPLPEPEADTERKATATDGGG